MCLFLTHAEFGYQADFLQENAGLAFEGSLSWFLALVCCGIKVVLSNTKDSDNR